MKKVIIIGSGIGGLATACLLGKQGYQVAVYEKNEQLGGRASVLKEEGFVFDMGPSWYLMPDVFEEFFEMLGEKIEDHLTLKKLSPSYRVFFENKEKTIDIFSDLEKDIPNIEKLEPGAGEKLKEYLKKAEYQYTIARAEFISKNYDSIFDFFKLKLLIQGARLSVFQKMHPYVKKFFKTSEVQKLMEYALLFLGSSPYNTPAIYNIMSHIDFTQGVFYPMGGIYEIIKALVKIGEKYGVTYHVDSEVSKILIDTEQAPRATGVEFSNGTQEIADIVISNADMAYTETKLIPKEYATYPETYWKKKTLSPSAFIMYLGIDGKIPELTHHNLRFCDDWKDGFEKIFDHPEWPEDTSYYVCKPSEHDPSVAPEGKECIFILVPIASGLEYTPEFLKKFGDEFLMKMEKDLGIPDLSKRIIYRKDFSVKDFESRYYSYKGSALGLAHTLNQTAIFRPNNRSKKVKNLLYVGANTNPGIGMPMCLISAQLVCQRLKTK